MPFPRGTQATLGGGLCIRQASEASCQGLQFPSPVGTSLAFNSTHSITRRRKWALLLGAEKNSINVLRIPLTFALTFANSSIISRAYVSKSP